MKDSILKSKLIRIFSDIVIVTVSITLIFLLRYLLDISKASGDDKIAELTSTYLSIYFRSLPVAISVCLITFYLNGFYTRGRYYTGKYKLICVLQAVSIAYLLIGLVAFLFSSSLIMPRSILLGGWVLTLLLIALSRIWNSLWKRIVVQESSSHKGDRKKELNNILIIGGAGYIGSALIKILLDSNFKLRLLDLFIYGEDPIKDLKNHPNLEIMKGDLRRVEDVVMAMRGMDAVIHLGAIVGDPACAIDEKMTLEINLMATQMLAEVAKANKIERFIFASTCSVYGANDEILDERSVLKPVSLYAKSKIASERVLANLRDESFKPTILRFGTIYGFSGRTRFDLVVNLLTAKAIVDSEITLYGGEQWRPFLHVNDAAKAVSMILKAPIERVGNEVFNVGSNQQNMTLSQVADLIKEIKPAAKILDLGSSEDRRNYRVNFDKISDRVGFAPEWSLEDGINQVVNAFEMNLVTDYTNSKYSNAKYLSKDVMEQMSYTTGWENQLIEESDS